jgi:hypothetical protein
MTQPTSGVEHGDGVQHGTEEHESEGHSVAAWTAVGIILLGSIIMSLAVVFPSRLWFVVGAVVVVVGAIAGKVLAMAGYGAKASTYQAAHRAGGRADLPGRSQVDSGTQ